MTVFLLTDPTGIGAGAIDSNGAFVDLVVIANETGIGLDPVAGGQRRVTYTRALTGAPQVRLDELVNTAFQPDYGPGPQNVDIVIVSLPDDFVFGDGSFGLVNNGTALAPNGSGLAGDTLNPTVNCLVLYDTQIDICLARDGTGGTLDLPAPGPVVLYHELSHARRIVRNELLALTASCDPSSPEENAAIIDENDMRTQLAGLLAEPPVLRDPGNHCADVCPVGGGGGCCIVASLVSGSARSPQVQRLREVRDGFLRTTETGHEFFERLHYDYYGFSPQVCTLIAGRPQLQEAVLHGFVEPLLEFWQFMIARSRAGDLSDADLGTLYVEHLPPAEERQIRLHRLEEISAYWDSPSGTDSIVTELFSLLRERAWPHESMQWTLIHPLRIQHTALTAVVDGRDQEWVGRALRTMLDEWTPQLPVTPVWGALPADQLADELSVCDQGLFVTEVARHAFRDRLLLRFPGVTAIGNLEGGTGGRS